MRPGRVLDALNFALAGAREGFGPFLGVYLQASGFDPAATGIAMSLAGVSGLVATTPLGALVDRTERKRLAMVAAVLAIAVGAVAIVVTRKLWVIGLAQGLIGVGDTAVAPLLSALTLGLVGGSAFGARMARNEAFNHAGNAGNAALAAALGYAFGLQYVAVAIVAMALASSAVVVLLDPRAIDHAGARSGEADERSTFRALLDSPGLLLLAAVVLLFETAHGALLPFLAQARTAAGSNPSITTGVMVVVGRIAMVAAALLAPRIAQRRSYATVMTAVLATAVVRGGLAALGTSWSVVIPVQLLEGLAMGLASVAIPTLSAEIMAGTGRANASLGVVLTAFGAGAALSPLVAGFVAQRIGFSGSFLVLGGVAALGLAVWLVGMKVLGLRFARSERPTA